MGSCFLVCRLIVHFDFLRQCLAVPLLAEKGLNSSCVTAGLPDLIKKFLVSVYVSKLSS